MSNTFTKQELDFITLGLNMRICVIETGNHNMRADDAIRAGMADQVRPLDAHQRKTIVEHEELVAKIMKMRMQAPAAAAPALAPAVAMSVASVSGMPYADIYTDGACKGNPGPGGWGFVVYDGHRAEKHTHCGSGGTSTTSVRMEMTAVLEALKFLQSNSSIRTASIRFDNEMVFKGLTQCMKGWKARGWKKADKTAVANQLLWAEIDTCLMDLKCEIQYHHVNGHAGIVGNERADELANQGVNA